MARQAAISDVICDLEGQPLHPDSVTLIKALDKLLTVGAYYSAEHDQYLQAAMKARDAIVGVIGGPGQHVAIEITAQGLMVGKQNIDPSHRNVRLLHELLVPLNIAKFEIDGSLTPEELRQALQALQEHKTALGQSHSFQEIVINNLPSSVRAISRSVLQRGDNDAGGGLSLDDLLNDIDSTSADDKPDGYKSESERLAREFMDMVTTILENMERLDRESDVQALDTENGTYVTRNDLVALKKALQRLVEVNPDPADLTKLISQAQRAMDLSRDAQSVDLVFQILKKDMAKKRPQKARRKTPATALPEYRLTVGELQNHATELGAGECEVGDPWPGSRENQFGIGIHLLRSDPPQALHSSLVALVESTITQPHFADKDLRLCAQAFETVVREDGVDGLDDLLPLFVGVLQQNRIEMVAPFWSHLIDLTAGDKLPEIWPHLVNAILLGFERAPGEIVTKLATTAGQISMKEALRQGRRLERQPALQIRTAASDLFIAPLDQLQPVLATLMSSPLKDWLGLELFKSLHDKPPTTLAKAIMAALGTHQPKYTGFYLEFIKHGDEDVLPKSVREPAAAIIANGLANLAPSQRQEAWVQHGLAELATLAPDAARPILKRVLNERKLLFFKAWPAPARAVAKRSLMSDRSEDR